ncbi:FHA domain-containing protein [Kribbella deserti]|uniref:FHA domain-containing protein n=1 Tax=Kribbella deserti TaxID=1926257 RepID=A0ABV6QUD4_9ACTN
MTSARLQTTRPSDAERDRAVEILRDGAGLGRISHDTFVRRLHFVLRAKSRAELADATRDLPGGEGRVRVLLRRITKRLPRVTVTPYRAMPVVPSLMLPGPDAVPVRIGRGYAANFRLADDSVSRCHAELRLVGESWILADVGSLNGTFLNGLRITSPVEVRPGDHVRFGGVDFQLRWTAPSATTTLTR